MNYQYALFTIPFIATAPLLALAVKFVRRRPGLRFEYFVHSVVGFLILLSVAGLATQRMDLWDAALLWFWFYNACRLAGPLWILSDSGPTEFSFPWNWKRVAVPVFGVMFDVALLLFFLRGVFDGNPTFNLKLVFFGSTLSFRAFRDVMESVVTVTTSGVRVGVRFYSWPELGPFRWLPSAGFGTPALQIQAPSAPGKEVRIRSAEDPAVEAVLLSHGLVKS